MLFLASTPQQISVWQRTWNIDGKANIKTGKYGLQSAMFPTRISFHLAWHDSPAKTGLSGLSSDVLCENFENQSQALGPDQLSSLKSGINPE